MPVACKCSLHIDRGIMYGLLELPCTRIGRYEAVDV